MNKKSAMHKDYRKNNLNIILPLTANPKHKKVLKLVESMVI